MMGHDTIPHKGSITRTQPTMRFKHEGYEYKPPHQHPLNIIGFELGANLASGTAITLDDVLPPVVAKIDTQKMTLQIQESHYVYHDEDETPISPEVNVDLLDRCLRYMGLSIPLSTITTILKTKDLLASKGDRVNLLDLDAIQFGGTSEETLNAIKPDKT